MISDGAQEQLTSVRADGPTIHLTGGRTPGSATAITLCGRAASGPVSAEHFHRQGCLECAQAAVDRGVTSVGDLHHATVNLPRFLAARRTVEPGSGRV